MIGSRSMVDRYIEHVPDPDIPAESEAMEHLLASWSVEDHVIEEACKIVETLADRVLAAEESRTEAQHEAAYLKVGLNFRSLRRANVERCEEVFHPLDSWTPSDWGVAMGGEAGETADALAVAILGLRVVGKSGQASNAIKKLNRGDGDVQSVAKELADMVIYADLLAARLDIDLAAAIIEKFNEVSEKRGSSVML